MSLPEVAPVATAPGRSGVLRATLRTPMGIAAAVAVSVVLALMIVAPIIWGDGADAYHPDDIGAKPSGAHLAGTDGAGRDILLRVLVAARLSIGLTLAATAIAVVVGIVLGSLPSLTGPRAGRGVTSALATVVAFPSLLLAIFFATIFGVGATGAVFALGFAGAPWFARLTQTLAASVEGRDYVAAARVLGISRLRVLLRHVLPNIAEPLAVNATIGAAANLLAFAGLSFLGLGVQAPSYDWGRLLLEGLNGIYVNPASALAPGIAIVLAGLAFNLAGELAAAALGRRSAANRRRPDTVAEVTVDDDSPAGTLLDVRGLRVTFPTADGWSTPVRGVDLRLSADESVGIVGESGSGKSLTALAVARLLEEPAHVSADRLTLDGHDLARATPREVRTRLRDSVAVVFQDPMTSLNPIMHVGRQLAEGPVAHHGVSRRAAWARAVEQLAAVRIPNPRRRARQLPHEFSGGMRQRAMIAMALMGEPKLIVADEPTTALDVTVQREVLQLLARARAQSHAALLMISHDIAVVAGVCDRLLVMYGGRVVEELPADGLSERAAHPYTRALLAALPDMTTPRGAALATIPGRPPRPDAMPAGCAFAARCEFATDRCRTDDPVLAPLPGDGHRVACWHPRTPSKSTPVLAPLRRDTPTTAPQRGQDQGAQR